MSRKLTTKTPTKRSPQPKVYTIANSMQHVSAFFGFDITNSSTTSDITHNNEIKRIIGGIDSEGPCFVDFTFGYENQHIVDAVERSIQFDKRILLV